MPGSGRGDVEAAFALSARRFAAAVRGCVVVLVSAFGVLGVSVPVAVFGVVVAGAAVDWWVAVTGRAAWAGLAAAVLRVVVVCWAAGQSEWALQVVTMTAITVQWEWRARVAVPVAGLLLAVHLATGGGGVAVVVRVVVECALARLGFALARRSSRRVDELRVRRAELDLAESTSVARRLREREYLALLHDTASSTFLLVAAGGADVSKEKVAEYARHDLSVLTSEPPESRGPVDLGASLAVVVSRVPLAVDARLPGGVLVPAPVALAVVRSVREALSNVVRHAGVGDAQVEARAGGRGVVVTVTDTGRGFRAEEVPSASRGIRGSVVERMAAVGGRAAVTSQPGRGTTVRLEWSGA
ncbi:sensor histidine kinase [Actinokineospora guangxiensis]|uniref:Sensor histidine kinase n=1 Tax=Actinokineospora guangxiensis TaxID=1490288 RepID=A0ABW0ET21_9PSEU